MMGTLNIPPGAGSEYVSLTLKRTPLNLTIENITNFDISFNNTDTFKTFYNGSIALKVGDKLHVFCSFSTGAGNDAHDLTLQLDLF